MLKEIVIGTFLGLLSGLGTGGGSLLILYLTLIVGMGQQDARAINLLFYIPAAVVACLFRWKQGRLEIKRVLPAIVAGSVTAGIIAFFSVGWDTAILRKLFGALLIYTGLRELFYKPKKE